MKKSWATINHTRFIHRSWKLNCPGDMQRNFSKTTSVQKTSDTAKTKSQCGRWSNDIEYIKEGQVMFFNKNKQGNDSDKQPSVIN